ncbi:MAG: IS701 family transposase, partial [Bacteroidota bacterium]
MSRFESYVYHWQYGHHDRSDLARVYLEGLIHQERGKANIERMVEARGSSDEYQRYQRFITDAPWSAQAVQRDVRADVSKLTEANRRQGGRSTGFLLDESGHRKSGTQSVGCTRQYLGHLGKVEMGQVGVYASLINDGVGSLVDQRLYLPKVWTGDKARCQKAGIPPQDRRYRSKPELALEMVDDALAAGIPFDWVGGDGLYGHNYELAKGLDERQVAFLLEVHCDQRVYLEVPELYIPEAKSGRGRKPTRLKCNQKPLRLDAYVEQLKDEDWTRLKVRKTTKGWLEAEYHARSCWVWDGREQAPRARTMLIRRDRNAQGEVIRTKYALANTSLEQTPIEELAYRQSQRYWIERRFQDAKQELGLSDFQVRKWSAWHHHHAICLLALYLMEAQKFDHQDQAPLMSVRDARIMVAAQIAASIIP